ncbi:hypothetical protein JYP52_21290 [Nitratireductor aquibiodomus]|uniref:hypothetical protein n=1 Tax=Nitratireductor TaxID=245876 RepID=UPI000DDE2559|nr:MULTISPECIES: hypothetical protein [Nitratireductor]MBN7763676.1 hypothetical protein [Nitratireductor aquibiodomus]
MKWIAAAKALPQNLGNAPAPVPLGSGAAVLLPAPHDVPVGLALDALEANGIVVESVTQTTQYLPGGLALDINMTVIADPALGLQASTDLQKWIFGKAKGSW